ncbi:hypothetical protein L1049_001066 [Liquidambar formosana]|uniref:Non-haem dioxygenase N-terminal domain-containing protein n=1 Tax=Liquidambar formosana TaxID=63359 RepID=A0AAP0R591_LIQFO
MEAKAVSVGSSLLVPPVKEVAKESMNSIPSRYVRPFEDEECLLVSDTNMLVHEVPVIDMHSLLCTKSMDSELAKLHFACKEWGFFQLVNHGVSSQLVERIKMEIQEFFNLPIEEKKKFWQYQGEVEGFGQAFVVSI